MDPKLKKRWVDNLRSGKFKKCRHALYTDGRYSALAVLAVMTGHGKEVPGGGMKFAGSPVVRRKELPKNVLEKLGISNGLELQLTQINDGTGKYAGMRRTSFKQVAKFIEEHV